MKTIRYKGMEYTSLEAALKLDNETRDEILAYIQGAYLGKAVYYKIDSIPYRNTKDIDFWLGSKTSIEGPASDTLLVERIGKEGEIKRPVILDVDNDVTVEGRHRLAAAKKFKLDVPIVMISGQKQKGWKKL